MPGQKKHSGVSKKKQLKKWIDKKERQELIDEVEGEPLLEQDNDNIYDKKEREQQLDESEIEPEEAAFMEGYEDTTWIECTSCNNQFDSEKAVEKEINGTTYRFCSGKCASHFEKRKAGLR